MASSLNPRSCLSLFLIVALICMAAPCCNSVPDATPYAVPDATPYAVPDATPHAVPDATPHAVPDANPDAVDVVTKALECFGDHYVYTSCQESYRLSPAGNIPVSPEATDEYCGGPCLVETKLVLSCVGDILQHFVFYNGATIQEVSYTLDQGCGHDAHRGDFNVQQRLGGYPGQGGQPDEYGYDFNHGSKPSIPVYLLFLVCGLAIWGY